MKKYDGKVSRIRLNLFFAANNLHDDHFSIYAALRSGPDTKIITNDLFTDHWQKLAEYGVLFRRWLTNRRIMVNPRFMFDHPADFEIRVTRLLPSTSSSKNRWIIPYSIEADSLNTNRTFVSQFFKYYLCEQKNK